MRLDPERNAIRVLLLAMMMGALALRAPCRKRLGSAGASLLRPMSPCNLFARS